jgi:hypothetical protein
MQRFSIGHVTNIILLFSDLLVVQNLMLLIVFESWCEKMPQTYKTILISLCSHWHFLTKLYFESFWVCSFVLYCLSVWFTSRKSLSLVFGNYNNHHHKHSGLGHLARSVSRVTVALFIVSSVSQLFSFLVGCSGMILKGFGFVAFFAGVKASSFCIHLSCLVCSLSVVRGEWSRLFCSHKGRNLPEVSITSFLLPQFFVSVRLSKSNILNHTKM